MVRANSSEGLVDIAWPDKVGVPPFTFLIPLFSTRERKGVQEVAGDFAGPLRRAVVVLGRSLEES